MLEINDMEGFLLAVDGPNGAGKSTLIQAISRRME